MFAPVARIKMVRSLNGEGQDGKDGANRPASAGEVAILLSPADELAPLPRTLLRLLHGRFAGAPLKSRAGCVRVFQVWASNTSTLRLPRRERDGVLSGAGEKRYSEEGHERRRSGPTADAPARRSELDSANPYATVEKEG